MAGNDVPRADVHRRRARIAFPSVFQHMSQRRRSDFICVAKVMYRTAESAQKAAERINARVNPGVVQAFKCASCEGWHVGTVITKRIGKDSPRMKLGRTQRR